MREPEYGPDARLDGGPVGEVSYIVYVGGIGVEGFGHVFLRELFEGPCFDF
jgi:hypothetical protein